jgi:hypothetical protein
VHLELNRNPGAAKAFAEGEVTVRFDEFGAGGKGKMGGPSPGGMDAERVDPAPFEPGGPVVAALGIVDDYAASMDHFRGFTNPFASPLLFCA